MAQFKRILGLNFFSGAIGDLLLRSHSAGLIVVPSAPVLADMATDKAHREAVEGADIAIADSGFMVLLWRLFRRERVRRISGLRYLRSLIYMAEFREPGARFWVMPSAQDAEANMRWLNEEEGLPDTMADCYVAPRYPKGPLEDQVLLQRLETTKPSFIVICLGGGVQERLGYFLRRTLSYRPTIVCTGAAIAFLSGQQVNIPTVIDRLYLGWLFRTLSNPGLYFPRYWRSLKVAALLWKHGEHSIGTPAGGAPVPGTAEQVSSVAVHIER
jgi:UDP-N-acetyl-D-mannosaminuronic acid transferase (WecB/TagA/CpsF family)